MDFSKLKYRVDMIPDTQKVVDHYPDLKRIPMLVSPIGLPEGVSADLALRYIILLFGQGSPFIIEINDLSKRKISVLNYLKVESDEKKQYPDGIVQMMSYQNESFRERLVTFLRLSRTEDWMLALACEQKNADLITMMFTPKEDVKEEKTLQEAIQLNRDNLVAARERLLAGEQARIAQDAIMQFLAEENLGIRPEDYMNYYAEHKTVFEHIVP